MNPRIITLRTLFGTQKKALKILGTFFGQRRNRHEKVDSGRFKLDENGQKISN
jgi:hypothetical protein